MSRTKTKASGIITLLTDFGTADGFASTMKGVMLSTFPSAVICDATHDIPPFDIASAGFVLSTYCREYPAGTVHVAVVDPGVGSERKPIAVYSDDRWFVCPDNGLLSFILLHSNGAEVFEIIPDKLKTDRLSATFHGRDVFAPAAAMIARGDSVSTFAKKTASIATLDVAMPNVKKGEIQGNIIHVDRFGNLVTNISEDILLPFVRKAVKIKVGSKTIGGISRTYASGLRGDLIAYIGSSGCLEIAIVEGSAVSAVKRDSNVKVVSFAKD